MNLTPNLIAEHLFSLLSASMTKFLIKYSYVYLFQITKALFFRWNPGLFESLISC